METTAKIKDLIPDRKNANKHTERGSGLVEKSLREYGTGRSILLDKNNKIIAGNLTAEQANAIGLENVRIIDSDGTDLIAVRRTDLDLQTDPKAKELGIADNRSAQVSLDWDPEALAFLREEGADLSKFFSEKELEKMGIEDEPLDEEESPGMPATPKTVLGDLYQLGRHRVLCGDARDSDAISKLLDGKKVDLVFTDPPYNVAYSNADRPKPSKKDLGKIQNDAMSSDEFRDLIVAVLSNADLFSKKDASIYLWYADREATTIFSSFDSSGWKRSQEIIWRKPMLLGRNRYQWAHESAIFGVKGSPYFTDDRTRTTVWDFGGYDKSKNEHPTQKPLVLCAEGIKNSSRPGDLVLDLFLGSGSTLIASEQEGRECYGTELDPKFVDVIVSRYVRETGNPTILRNGEEILWEE